MKRVLAGLLPAVLLITACGGGGDPAAGGGGAREVTLTLNWYPYGEHAPFYYGVKQGIYDRHGIKLKIQAGQGSGKTVTATGAGQTDFGWADTSALATAVEQGVPAKSIGVFLQTTPASVQFFTEKNISRPEDLKGKSVATTAGDALTKTFPAFLKQNGMRESDVSIQNIDPAGKMAAVISGRTDVLLGFASDQGPTIEEKAGKDVGYLRFADFGLNYFSNGLLTSKSVLQKDPELVRKMVAATQEAWAQAEKAPEAAAESMKGAAEQLPSPAVVLEQFKTTLTLLHTDATKGKAPGVNTAEDWRRTIETFQRTGIITEASDPSAYWEESVAPKG
ncbi:NitT/TauT family transport system substrate-binding protein [Lentzea xinjiangensis]|uniref:NitT/TauT family transport system substrate-binding protein n=1 Tax=Lentzea xinjiangensis TaxID=402600 RepID=A0A1H9M5F2_9PSEU|nr:ABC transporter substrate-binding protein [Lentzea xinjiangensis]SER18771.1 NitT/TauT family transport system substrate-binding protein [Lentzea xinjiangensis]